MYLNNNNNKNNKNNKISLRQKIQTEGENAKKTYVDVSKSDSKWQKAVKKN